MPRISVYGIELDVAQGANVRQGSRVTLRVCERQGDEMMEAAE